MQLLAQASPQPGPLDWLNASINNFTQTLLAYGLMLVAVGIVTMALLELLKGVTFARMFFHRWRIHRWIGGPQAPAYQQLLTLAASGIDNASALFDQPSDKVMGQIQAAANVALDFPLEYAAFYRFLTDAPRAGPASPEDRPPDNALWLEHMARFRADPIQAADEAKKGSPESVAANNARARLDHFVSRRLDAFQTSVEYWWARANQTVAVIGGAMMLYIFLLQKDGAHWLAHLWIALIGGMVAPFAKDLVAALQKLRT